MSVGRRSEERAGGMGSAHARCDAHADRPRKAEGSARASERAGEAKQATTAEFLGRFNDSISAPPPPQRESRGGAALDEWPIPCGGGHCNIVSMSRYIRAYMYRLIFAQKCSLIFSRIFGGIPLMSLVLVGDRKRKRGIVYRMPLA